MNWLHPSEFDWNDNPPLSSHTSVYLTSISYILLVVASTTLSRLLIPVKYKKNDDEKISATKRTDLQWKPWFGSDLKHAQTIHNIVLIVSSAMMLYGVLSESWNRLQIEREANELVWPTFLICEENNTDISARGALYYWSYMYYLSKYYELLDTALQLARGKPPPNFFLHVYHHAAVLIMAWLWCDSKQSLQFIGLAFNTFVHVVMYTYFLQRTFTGKVPKWKALVTIIQIIQFAFSMVAAIMTLFVVHVQKRECAGMNALYFNILFNITLLHSFIGVFKKGQKKKAKMVQV